MQTQNYKLWVYVKIEKYWKLLQPFMDAFLKIKTTIYERRFCIFFVFLCIPYQWLQKEHPNPHLLWNILHVLMALHLLLNKLNF